MIIEVQHCVDCHLHNWCSRHNEAKYHDFFNKMEAKAKALLPHPTIIKNSPPPHYQPRNPAATTGLQVHHYFDEESQEEVVFPRHGSFEIKFNGILIFSKLQSNLWPNMDKIASLFSQMRIQIEAGRDISKFSLEFRQQSNQQELAETYKKLITFKINKRPHSSVFNASTFLSKVPVEQSPEPNKECFKRKNVTSLKKGGFDVHRKSDVIRKPLIRFRNSKVEAANMYVQFPEAKNEDHCQLPEVGRAVKNELCSPHSKKKIQFKNDALYPIRAQPFEVITNNGPVLKLEKKPSRKLILKHTQKKGENSPHQTNKFSDNFDEPSDPSDQVIMGATPFFPQLPTKKSFKSLKSVMSIGEKVDGRANEIKVEEYTEKRIDSRQEMKAKKTSILPSIIHTLKLVNQQAEDKNQPLVEKTQQHISEKVEEKLKSPQKIVEQVKQIKYTQPTPIEVENCEPMQEPAPQKGIEKPVQDELVEKDEEEEVEEEAYDQFEQPEEQPRPETSSSQRMHHEEQALREEEMLEHQEVIEGNFRKKGNTTVQKVNQEDEEQQYPPETTQEIPVSDQNLPQEQLLQENCEDIPVNAYVQPEQVMDLMPSNEEKVILPQQEQKVEGPCEVSEEDSVEFKLDEPQSFLLSSQRQQLVRLEKAEVQASISRMEETLLNSIIQKEPTVVDANLPNQPQHMDSVPIQHTIDSIIPAAQVSVQFEGQQAKQPEKQPQHNEQQMQQLQGECKPQAGDIPEDSPSPEIIEDDGIIASSCPQQPTKEEQALKKIEEQHEVVVQADSIPQPSNMADAEENNEQIEQKMIQNKQDDEIHQAREPFLEQQPHQQSSPQEPTLMQESASDFMAQQVSNDPKIKQDDQSPIQQQNQVLPNQPEKEVAAEGIQLEAKGDVEPICSVRQGIQQQPHLAEKQEIQDRQVARPSIHQLSDKESCGDPPTLRSIPNGTQSSIGITSQIHSELNNVYQQIQARLDSRLSWQEDEQPNI